MSENREIAQKNVEMNEVISFLKSQDKNLKMILRKIEKMQEFHEINDMTNQVFETRLTRIENQLNQMNSKIKAV